jgi:ABC-type uncharacterized transport system involved in gliding motility auxiliary subunit
LILAHLVANFSKLRAATKTRAARFGGAAVLMTLLVLGILAIVNFLSVRHQKRVDLTEQQLYSLSEQTRKVLENLETEVEVMGFFRTEPARISFQNFMQEFRYVSSRFNYEGVDPEEDPGKTSQYEIQRNGQVVVSSGPKREMVDDYSEEKIINAVIKVTRTEEKVIYFLEGHGERGIQDTEAEGFSLVREAVEKQNYQVKSYNLAQENKVPEDATLLVSARTKVNFFPNEVNLLQEYLASGGKLLLLVDPDSSFEMPDFLEQYGLGLGNKMVIDASGLGQLFGLGAAAPLVAEYADHPIGRELGGVMTFFPFSQNVTISESSLGYQTTGLLKTSESSWAESDLRGGRAAFDPGQDLQGPLDLAVASTLSIAGETEDQEENAPTGDGEEQQEAPETPAAEARLVLFGDSDFASNGYFGAGANGDLFLMTISWLAEEADLIAIRPKSPEDRRIEATMAQSMLIFWGAVILLPAITLVLGVVVWYRRR